jgi:thioredoxin reductase/NAD-dependent dihydropyrimidine dehydrogenase PreA subunit
LSAHRPPSGDVTRGLRLGVAALVAMLAVAVAAVLAPAAITGAPGALARPHVVAGVTCAGCHGEHVDGPATGAGCVTCHGAHPSTRGAHKALAARGQLGCPSCHTAHGGAEGVSFAADGEAVRWRATAETRVDVEGPAGATVALVPLAACARCHDASRASDPLRACIAAGGAAGIDACLDEHQTPSQPLAASGKCAHQHGPSRFVAWEAARAVLDAAPAPAARPARAAWLWVGSGLGAGCLAFAGAAVAQQRRRKRAASGPPAAPLAPAVVRLPLIDAARCLGCHACVDACPFDVLSVDRHVAVVARPDECCGVGSCEAACPNGSLRLAAEGEPLPDRPRVDARLESTDRRGVFLAGDLTGVPLIRSAITQGTRVAEHAAADLRASPRGAADGKRVDLAVVGAGPAGLAAALRAQELGLSCIVLEQSTVAATLRAFPRGKIVHDPPLELPLEGPLWLRESTKEELVAQWTRIVRAHRVDVREQHRVTALTGEAGAFTVRADTPSGPRALHAARVVFAIGRRGTPRTLDVPVAPAAAGRVVHALSDARALAGKRVLVVGLGDSAMEAVVALARQPGTTVTVSYRGSGFSRGRARNIDEVRRLAEAGRVRILWESAIERVDERWVMVRGRGGAGEAEKLAVDAVLALLGGEPSRAVLGECGIGVEAGPGEVG